MKILILIILLLGFLILGYYLFVEDEMEAKKPPTVRFEETPRLREPTPVPELKFE